MNTTFGIIGNGSWATALAKMLTKNGQIINWWMRNENAKNHFIKNHHNLHYLTSVEFDPEKIIPSTDIEHVIRHSERVVLCIPSAYVVDLLKQLPRDVFKEKIIISAIKGIIPSHHMLLNDYLAENFLIDIENYISITGPCHAEEVAQERLSYLTFSGLNLGIAENISKDFRIDYIQTGINNDLWGSQYAAVLKNIYAIGAGIAHGLGYGDNFLSVYITNCYREMFSFLIKQFEKVHPSEKMPDFHTSAYLGDLLVTCYSPHSRNRTFGTLLGKGYSITAASAEMNMIAEGYLASKGMQAIIQKLDLSMPIAGEIYKVLWEGKIAKEGFEQIESFLS